MEIIHYDFLMKISTLTPWSNYFNNRIPNDDKVQPKQLVTTWHSILQKPITEYAFNQKDDVERKRD